MSELGNYIFELLPEFPREKMIYFIGGLAVVLYFTRHDD